MDTLSDGMRVGLRVLFTFAMGALALHYGRILRFYAPGDSVMFAPLWIVLTPKWERLLYARTWTESVVYVFQTCGLCTLVHPYLGSKLQFHYCTCR